MNALVKINLTSLLALTTCKTSTYNNIKIGKENLQFESKIEVETSGE